MNCQRYNCEGKLKEWGDEDYYCEECDENHKKVGENFVLSHSDSIKEIDFGICSECDSKLYISHSGRDISVMCSGCDNRFEIM